MVPRKRHWAKRAADNGWTRTIIVVAPLIFGEHKVQDMANDAKDAKHEADQSLALGKAFARITDLEASRDTLRRDVKALRRASHMSQAQVLAAFPIGPPAPVEKTGVVAGIGSFIGSFFSRRAQ